ncbi:MAG: hypothetical protein ACRED1_11920 [Limisphaerales bacterium]
MWLDKSGLVTVLAGAELARANNAARTGGNRKHLMHRAVTAVLELFIRGCNSALSPFFLIRLFFAIEIPE